MESDYRLKSNSPKSTTMAHVSRLARCARRTNAMKLRPLAQLMCLLTTACPLLFAVDREWKIGKVLDSTSAKTYARDSMFVKDTQLLIAGDEFSYLIDDPVSKTSKLPTHHIVTRSIANRGHGCRFIVGDNVKYAQDKSNLHILDADGKECKLEILRQNRLQIPQQ